jgi:hypothetical protein
MRLKIQKMLGALLLASCLLPLTACSDMGVLSDDYKQPTVAVAAITTPPPPVPQKVTPTIYCRIGRGEALFGNTWHDYTETTFALPQGDYINVSIPRPRSTENMTVQALFDNSGQKIIFCPVIDGPTDQRISCFSIYAMEDDLHEGIKRTLDIPRAIRSGTVSCAYQQEHLRVLAVPVSGGY